MSITVIKDPSALVEGDVKYKSKWSSVHHPMVYEMQRTDYYMTFTKDKGAIKCAANMPNKNPLPISVGDTVFLINEATGASGSFVVLYFNGFDRFEVSGSSYFNSSGFGSLTINSRLNYHVLTNIYTVSEQNQYTLAGQSINTPNTNGVVKVDVSSFLKQQVDYVDTFDYSLTNDKDLTLGGGFAITYSENWTGHAGEFSGINSDNLRYFVNSAKQIKDLYGSNMGEYVPFYLGTPSQTDLPEAKFLTDFKNPTVFKGYPFSLSFIYGEQLAGFDIQYHNSYTDINNNLLSINDYSANIAKSQSVNRFSIDTNINVDTKTIYAWLDTDGSTKSIKGFATGMIAPGFIETYEGQKEIENPI